MAQAMRLAGREFGVQPPGVKSHIDMIEQWERGDHVPDALNRAVHAKALGKTEAGLVRPAPSDELTLMITSDSPRLCCGRPGSTRPRTMR
jgi:hypothetical protein